jgi:hypothetical protein
MGLFSNVISGSSYRFTKEVIGSSVDDNEKPRFPDDTHFEPGTEFQIARQPHAWPAHSAEGLFYTILVKGSEYNVHAADVEHGAERLSGTSRTTSN